MQELHKSGLIDNLSKAGQVELSQAALSKISTPAQVASHTDS